MSDNPRPEVTEVTSVGFRLLVAGRERYLSFHDFPWFERAPAWKIRNVDQVSDDHLRWPELDIDLSVESIDDPERFPLVWKAAP
ncbi:MAG: DUF2442 domain-containing protein [Acidobacteriota bacterium]|nr:DUF2442 domain-containing protein [Acidobacteriota bacterium]